MKKINTTKLSIISILCISLITFIIYCASVLDICSIKRININEITRSGSEKDISYFLDDYSLKKTVYNTIITINGWVFKKGVASRDASIQVLVSNKLKSFLLPTNIINRPDITYTNEADNINYDNSGFSVSIDSMNTGIDENYNIYILYDLDGKNYLIDTNTKLIWKH